MRFHIVCHLHRKRAPEAENATRSAFYDAKVSFNCSYSIAASAKSLFKPPQTCWETMASCSLQQSECESAPPDTSRWVLLLPNTRRDRKKSYRMISTKGHELTPPWLVQCCSWLKSWCLSKGEGKASWLINKLWAVPGYMTIIKWVASVFSHLCFPFKGQKYFKTSNALSSLNRKCGGFILWRGSAVNSEATKHFKTKRLRRASLSPLPHWASSEFSSNHYHIEEFFCPTFLPKNTFLLCLRQVFSLKVSANHLDSLRKHNLFGIPEKVYSFSNNLHTLWIPACKMTLCFPLVNKGSSVTGERASCADGDGRGPLFLRSK